MKKRFILLTACLISVALLAGAMVFPTVRTDAAVAFQRVGFVNAVVTGDVVNVRQAPSTTSKVVCTVKKGQTVKIFGKLGDWYAIYEPGTNCVGVVYAKYLKTSAATAPTPAPAKVTTPAPAKAATPTPAPSKGGVTPAPSTNASVSADEQAMLNLVNKARADAGLGALQFDAELQKVARIKAKDMVDKNYFSHQSPTYGSPFDMMRQFGISFKTAGENIAGNQTVDAAFKAWMASPGHKANILNGSFNYTGIGIVSGSSYGKIFVQMFIGR